MNRRVFRNLAMIIGTGIAATVPALAHDEADTRVAVVVPEDDRDHLLEDMREFLERTSGLLQALAADDMARVKTLADGMRPPLPRARALADGRPMPVGRQEASATGRPLSDRDRTRFGRMQQNLPQGFRNMMLELRQGVAAVARDVETINDPRHTLRQLAQVQQVCVACHRAYRLVPGDPESPGHEASPTTSSNRKES